MIKYIKLLVVAFIFFGIASCKKYLDIVPDNVATVDMAFRLRSQAKKYLYTCYSYLPKLGDWANNPALLSGDEIWYYYPNSAYIHAVPENWEVARGNQSKLDPYLDYWNGSRGGNPLFEAIRDCNTFLDNIDKVPDMDNYEKERWKGEVMFLKAYYNWFLLRMYGPIPIIDKNLPVSSLPDQVKFYRQPVDSVFNYIVKLLDSVVANPNLPGTIADQVTEMGRITKPIVLSLKARVLLTAASPLFNGNPDYGHFMDNKGRHLFSTGYEPAKWDSAAKACKEAIDMCQGLGYHLYYFDPPANISSISAELQGEMNIRNTIFDKWNPEIIWGSTNSEIEAIQRYAQARIDPSLSYSSTSSPHGSYAPTLRIAEMFYTKNGVPIDQDKTWDYAGRYELQTASVADKNYIEPGYTTAKLHFDREPRFYADLGFDGGLWYGQGRFNDNDPGKPLFHVENRLGHYSGKSRSADYSITGYYAKKLVNYLNTSDGSTGAYSYENAPFPVIRLADLYLMYSEALNEINGPSQEAYTYINLVRQRASLPTVQDAWTNYSTNPDEYTTKDGFRKIIHRERLIEMAFEGSRYWDLLRWKEAAQIMSEPIRGWDILQTDPEFYYQPKVLFSRTFENKDYFWPINDNNIIKNGHLVQNPNW